MPNFERSRAALAVGCFALGLIIDFVLCGVFKVIWFLIYFPAYLAAGKGIESRVARSRLSKHSHLVILSLTAGALIGHFTFTSRKHVEMHAWLSQGAIR
jgi:hypothetical protein